MCIFFHRIYHPNLTDSSAFWYTGPLGLAQHDDFWDIIARNVHIYRNDIRTLKRNSIVLDDDTEILSDALLCGTGWQSSYPFFSKDLLQSLGLPCLLENNEIDPWTTLLNAADDRVLSNFPQLAHPPPHLKPDVPTSTTRLYRGIAPLEDHTIAFLGHIDISNSFRAAEAQAIWSTAYLDGSMALPSLEQMKSEVAYMNAFSKRRYPSHGQKGDCAFFELVWYTDGLLNDVGLTSHRKGWWSNWVEPCLAADFKHVKDEYLNEHQI